MKKCIAILVGVVIIISAFNNAVYADDLFPNNGLIYSNGLVGDVVEPNIYTPCTGGNGICQMYRRGNASVYNKATSSFVYTEICCWQCINCYTVIATTGDPGAGYSIGNYVITSCDYQIPVYFAWIFIDSLSEIHYTNSSNLSGYSFIYHY